MSRKLVEQRLGFEITDGQYEEALEKARKKLRTTIQRFGDAAGDRRKPAYLAELVAEAIRSELLMKYTAEFALLQ